MGAKTLLRSDSVGRPHTLISVHVDQSKTVRHILLGNDGGLLQKLRLRSDLGSMTTEMPISAVLLDLTDMP